MEDDLLNLIICRLYSAEAFAAAAAAAPCPLSYQTSEALPYSTVLRAFDGQDFDFPLEIKSPQRRTLLNDGRARDPGGSEY